MPTIPTLTPEVHALIVKCLRAGNYIETAANYAGTTRASLYTWLHRGAQERKRLAQNPRARPLEREARYLAFSRDVEQALAHAEIHDLGLIGAAAKTQWQAAAWRLERRNPERWGRKDSLQLLGRLDRMSRDELVDYITGDADPIARDIEETPEG